MQAVSHSLAHRESTRARWRPLPPFCPLLHGHHLVHTCIPQHRLVQVSAPAPALHSSIWDSDLTKPLPPARSSFLPLMDRLRFNHATTSLTADHTAISTRHCFLPSHFHGTSSPFPRCISRHSLWRAGPRQRCPAQEFRARGIASFMNVMRRASNSPVLH
jgi:hypothetical protein